MKRAEAQTVVPDLLDTLERIGREARETKERIALGYTPKGSAALSRIEQEARDAILRVKERA